ncbi:MAG: DUF1553 domain-containing protein [Gemmataceae bacterium]
MERTILLVGFLALGALFSPPVTGAESKPTAGQVEFFEKKIRPLLVEQCQACHSGKKHRGSLLLDSRAGLIKGGDTGPSVVPGHPEKSLLIQAISYREQLRMPPRSKLSDEQIADLTAWVKMGAPWPGSEEVRPREEKMDLARLLAHWSFQPVRSVAVPGVPSTAWARNPIDQFILHQLERRKIAPAPESDRRTWLRRVTFDLTGLPPTREEIVSFLQDSSPTAHARVVDRLLASPAYGERWGRHWLDLMRFAETSGHEFDFEIPHAYAYRDYVIRALNADVPYDEFTREHLAGDLVSQPRRHPLDGRNESILGTGFWFLGESKHSPVDLRGDGSDRRDNMIDVFGKSFLGLTIACARCHDHKFDPITTREYYSLVSTLQSSRQQRAFLDPPERIAEPASRIASRKREAARQAVQESSALLEKRLRGWSMKQALEDKSQDPVFLTLRRALQAKDFAAAKKELAVRQGRESATLAQYRVFADFTRGNADAWYLTGHAFQRSSLTGQEVEVGSDLSQPVKRLVQGVTSGSIAGRLQGALRSPTFTIDKKHLLYRARGRNVVVNLIIDGFQQIRDPIYGGLRFVIQSNESRWYVQNLSMWVGLQAYIEILDDGDGEVELEQVVQSDHGVPPPLPLLPSLVTLIERAASPEELFSQVRGTLLQVVKSWREGKPLDADQRGLLQALLSSDQFGRSGKSGDAPWQALLHEAASLESKLPDPLRGLAMADGNGIQDRVHIRGNPRTLGEEAPRVLPIAVAGPNQTPAATGSGRIEMAKRLTRPENPLLARVMVNRLWHHHFGQGLVRTVDDFGHQGEKPTHPELLDWLASEFVRSGWSVKAMHRMMVLSSTYRMSSRGSEEADLTDPRNELLHRMPIRRLEAEVIRDAMLSVSGRLNRSMFGRGPLPHLTEFMDGRGRPGSGPLDGDGRRSVYLNVRRNFLSPMFLAFDYPIPFTTMGRRSVSNVPAQALSLLNNPFVLQQAQGWAQHQLQQPASDRQRITSMYEAAFARLPTEQELQEAEAFLGPAQAREGRAWADLAHVLMNVKEFFFVN